MRCGYGGGKDMRWKEKLTKGDQRGLLCVSRG
jgi:hypothetical protein